MVDDRVMKKQRDSTPASAAEGVIKIGAGLIPALRLTDAKEVKGEGGNNAWPSPPPAWRWRVVVIAMPVPCSMELMFRLGDFGSVPLWWLGRGGAAVNHVRIKKERPATVSYAEEQVVALAQGEEMDGGSCRGNSFRQNEFVHIQLLICPVHTYRRRR